MANSSKWVAIPRFDFSGGINTRYSEIGLEDNELVDCYNYHITPNGGLVKRKGLRKIPSTATADSVPVNSLYQLITDDVSVVLRTKGGKIEYLGPSDWVDISANEVVSPDPDINPVWTTFRKHAVVTDGINPILKWNGTISPGFEPLANAIDGGANTIDKAKVALKHRGMLVLGNVWMTEAGTQTHYESRLIRTATGTLDTWTSTVEGFTVDVSEGDGDEITALLDIDGILIVFKNRSLHKVTNFGRAGIQDVEFIGNVGTPGAHTALVVGIIVFFLDMNGYLWAFNTQGDDETALMNLGQPKLGPETMDQIVLDRLPSSVLYYDPFWAEVVFATSMPDTATTQNTVWWAYSLITQGFTRHEYPNRNLCFATTVTDSFDRKVRIGGGYNGLVYQLETNKDDDGVAIESFFITDAEDFGDLSVEKILEQVLMYVRVDTTKNITIEHRKDFSKTGIQNTESVSPPGADYAGTPLYGGLSLGDTSDNTPNVPIGSETPTVGQTYPDGAVEYLMQSTPEANESVISMAEVVGQGDILVASEINNVQKVKRLSKDDLSNVWSTQVSNGTLFEHDMRGVVHSPATERIFAWSKSESIFVLNESGTLLDTIDVATEIEPSFSIGGSVFQFSQQGFVRDGVVYMTFWHSGSTFFHYLLGIDATTGAYVSLEGPFDGTTGAAPGRFVFLSETSKYYFTASGDLKRMESAFGSGGNSVIITDHGNLDGSGYTSGTNTSGKGAYNSKANRFCWLGATDWCIGDPVDKTHPDGTPHSPSHKYLPSSGGTAHGLTLLTIAQVGYNKRADRWYIVHSNGTTLKITKLKGGINAGSVPIQIVETTMLTGTGFAGSNVLLYGEETGLIFHTGPVLPSVVYGAY